MTVLIDLYDWIYLRVLWGDQHAVRYEVAKAVLEKEGSGDLWKWKSHAEHGRF